MSTSPYAAADPAKLAEILRLAESRLAAQLTLGVAADQRAMTMASFLAALDAAVIAVWAVIGAGHAVPIGALVFGFGIAATIAAFSAQPVAWDTPGAKPSDWTDDIVDGDTLHNGLAAMAEHYDSMISQNDRVLSSNGNAMRLAFVFMLLTLLLAACLAALVI
jgi:hypothetical protein